MFDVPFGRPDGFAAESVYWCTAMKRSLNESCGLPPWRHTVPSTFVSTLTSGSAGAPASPAAAEAVSFGFRLRMR